MAWAAGCAMFTFASRVIWFATVLAEVIAAAPKVASGTTAANSSSSASLRLIPREISHRGRIHRGDYHRVQGWAQRIDQRTRRATFARIQSATAWPSATLASVELG